MYCIYIIVKTGDETKTRAQMIRDKQVFEDAEQYDHSQETSVIQLIGPSDIQKNSTPTVMLSLSSMELLMAPTPLQDFRFGIWIEDHSLSCCVLLFISFSIILLLPYWKFYRHMMGGGEGINF